MVSREQKIRLSLITGGVSVLGYVSATYVGIEPIIGIFGASFVIAYVLMELNV